LSLELSLLLGGKPVVLAAIYLFRSNGAAAIFHLAYNETYSDSIHSIHSQYGYSFAFVSVQQAKGPKSKSKSTSTSHRRQLLSISGETQYAAFYPTPLADQMSPLLDTLSSPSSSFSSSSTDIRWPSRSKESARRNRSHIADRGVPATPLHSTPKYNTAHRRGPQTKAKIPRKAQNLGYPFNADKVKDIIIYKNNIKKHFFNFKLFLHFKYYF